MKLKHELEASIRTFVAFYDEFAQNRTKLDMEVYNHFHEIRFQIDQHREELKKRIDDIALEMIDKVKKHEETFFKNLKQHFSSFDEINSIENKLNEIEETFPNILIEAIREMQQKQDESLNEIQFKLDEINQVKDNLKASNEFKPNLSLFNLEGDTSLFGFIKFKRIYKHDSIQQ